MFKKASRKKQWLSCQNMCGTIQFPDGTLRYPSMRPPTRTKWWLDPPQDPIWVPRK